MKLQELRAQVYKLAGVNSTQQLKANYEEMRSLDMRRKISWEKALAIVQTPPPSEFQNWLKNPPDEYKELFAEIESTSKTFAQKRGEARQLHQAVTSMANSLEDLASECQDEADRLKQAVKAARRIAKQARMN